MLHDHAPGKYRSPVWSIESSASDNRLCKEFTWADTYSVYRKHNDRLKREMAVLLPAVWRTWLQASVIRI